MNLFNNDTFKACTDVGIRYLSSDIIKDPPPWEATVRHYPANVETAIYLVVLGYWTPYSREELQATLDHSIAKYGYAVLTVHSQQFSKIVEGKMTNDSDEAYFSDFLRFMTWIRDTQAIVQLRQLDDSRYSSISMKIGSMSAEIKNVSVVAVWGNAEQVTVARRPPTILRVKRLPIALSVSPSFVYGSREGERIMIFMEITELNATGQTLNLTGEKPFSVTISTKTQYRLSVASEHGTPRGEGWYDSGSYATIHVEPSIPIGFGRRYVLTSWEGVADTDAPSPQVLMDRPRAVRAVWAVDNTTAYVMLAIATAVIALLIRFVHSQWAYSRRKLKIDWSRRPSTDSSNLR